MHNAKRTIAICLVLCMLLSVLPVSALAINITTKPENGTTEGQPFAPGTGGSANFRIPGIVTLDNGTLIAACDARWNHSGDGAGLDTIVSVSTDNGENWTYTYANYLGDNGDVYNNLSTCFIDPGIGTDGTTAYLIADLWPAGIALNTSKYSPVAGKTGYDANGNLALRDASQDTVPIGWSGYNTMAANAAYDYYLDLETLQLCKNDGTVVEGYTVDAYFNITGNGVDTNLFFSDSPYQPYPTDYLYMTTSTDGLTWSEPKLLNLKEASEQTLLIGPGNGTYDAVNDRMIFTGYEHSSGYERASLIWMDGEGNWYRSEDATVNSWSSEATSVVLDDGTVRTFYRDGYTTLRYTDYVFDEELNNYVRADYEVDTGVAIDSGCQLTSILYSQEVDGKDLVLVAGPTSSRRINGYIYAFLVDADNSMELAYAYNVTPDFYAYSCLTELADGRIGLLYESAGSKLTYVAYDYDEIITRDNDPRLSIKEIEIHEGYSEVITDSTGYYVDADISELDTTVATLTMTGEEVTTNAAQILGTGSNIDLDSCQYTFTATDDGYYEVSATTLDGETVYLNHFSTTANNIPNVTSPAGKIAILESEHENMFKLQAQIIEGAGSGAARGLHFHAEAASPYWNRCGNDSSYKCHEYLYRKAAAGEASSQEIPGYVLITSADEVVSGGQYLIAAKNDAGNWYVLNPSTSNEKFNHVAQIMGSTTVGRTELTFTGVGGGYTEVVVGTTIYKITVHGANDIHLDIGESHVVTDDTGYYVDADLSALDTSIATVELTGEITGYEQVLSEKVEAVESGKTYVFYNKAARKLIGNEWADASVGGGGTDGLALDSTLNSFDENDLWTVTATEGGYYVQDQNGKYMSIARGKGLVKDEPVVINLDFDGNDWTIGENGEYANDFGGAHSAVAGWSDINDVNSQWDFYEVNSVAQGTTTITFTGVGEGETSVQIGDRIYTITVTEPYVDPADDSRDIPLPVLEVSAGDWQTGYEDTEGPAELAVDEDPNTIWHTDWYGTSRENHWFQFELTDTYIVDGLRYWPRQTGNSNGTITEYEIQVSNDGVNFRTVATGEWENNRNWKLVRFDGENVKYVRMYAVNATTDNNFVFASAAEIRLTGEKTDAPLPHEHAFGEWTVTTPATCTDPGVETRTCECGESETREIAALGHDAGKAVVENEKPATCTEPGSYDSVVYCSECGVELSRETVTVDALGHDAGKAVVENEKAATCTEPGSYDSVVYCSECGVELSRETVTVDALGHTAAEAVKENEKAATCTEAGSYDLVVYCTVCNAELSRETVTVDALGHTAAEAVKENEKAATCTEAGSYDLVVYCTVCNAELSRETVTVDALGHTAAEAVVENEKAATCTEDGSYDLVVYCSVCNAVLSRETVTVPAECASSAYSDVPVGDWYHEAVDFVTAEGIMNGMGNGKFEPATTTNRAMMAVLLYRLAGEPSVEGLTEPFTDVAGNEWFADAVIWAYNKGIVNGVTADTFAPAANINRAQMVTMLYRAAGSPTVDTSVLAGYTDADKLDFSADAFAWAISSGIVTGMTETTLAPTATANRAQIAVILFRYLSK